MIRFTIVGWLVSSTAWAETPPLDLTSLPDSERREAIRTTPRELIAQIMNQTPQSHLLAMGRRVVLGFNTYSYRMVKQERVRGELLPAQTIDVFVRESPFAVRLHYVKGPGTGRKVVFNPSVRTAEFRVREAGFLSIAGAIWLDVNSSFAKADSNHTVNEAGIGPLLARLVRDSDRARPLGGFSLAPEGWNENGEFCGTYVSPRATPAFDYAKTRICTDLTLGVPTRVEGFGVKGELLEKWHFSNFKPDTWGAEFFDPTRARL